MIFSIVFDVIGRSPVTISQSCQPICNRREAEGSLERKNKPVRYCHSFFPIQWLFPLMSPLSKTLCFPYTIDICTALLLSSSLCFLRSSLPSSFFFVGIWLVKIGIRNSICGILWTKKLEICFGCCRVYRTRSSKNNWGFPLMQTVNFFFLVLCGLLMREKVAGGALSMFSIGARDWYPILIPTQFLCWNRGRWLWRRMSGERDEESYQRGWYQVEKVKED